jgi:hypothetical protein
MVKIRFPARTHVSISDLARDATKPFKSKENEPLSHKAVSLVPTSFGEIGFSKKYIEFDRLHRQVDPDRRMPLSGFVT